MIFILCAVYTDEIDSYMYQSVGHHAIDMYAEAMGLPLYRRTITGSALVTDRHYREHPNDEVEDLFLLLQDIQVLLMLFTASDQKVLYECTFGFTVWSIGP